MVHGLDVFGREHAHLTPAPPLPATSVRAVQKVDDVTTQETELGGVMRREVEEGVSVPWPLEEGGKKALDTGDSFRKRLVKDRNLKHFRFSVANLIIGLGAEI